MENRAKTLKKHMKWIWITLQVGKKGLIWLIVIKLLILTANIFCSYPINIVCKRLS